MTTNYCILVHYIQLSNCINFALKVLKFFMIAQDSFLVDNLPNYTVHGSMIIDKYYIFILGTFMWLGKGHVSRTSQNLSLCIFITSREGFWVIKFFNHFAFSYLENILKVQLFKTNGWQVHKLKAFLVRKVIGILGNGSQVLKAHTIKSQLT